MIGIYLLVTLITQFTGPQGPSEVAVQLPVSPRLERVVLVGAPVVLKGRQIGKVSDVENLSEPQLKISIDAQHRGLLRNDAIALLTAPPDLEVEASNGSKNRAVVELLHPSVDSGSNSLPSASEELMLRGYSSFEELWRSGEGIPGIDVSH